MKLIDILVQELPKRGGWPVNAEYCSQWDSGCVIFYGLTDSILPRRSFSVGLSDKVMSFTNPTITVDNQMEYRVTRKQYESALASHASQITPMGTLADAVAEAVSAAELRSKGGTLPDGVSYNHHDEPKDSFPTHCLGVLDHGRRVPPKKNDAVAEAANEFERKEEKKNPYLREIKPGVWVDVYDVMNAWAVTNPALQHLLKKALQPGERGHKSREQDLQDIIDSAIRAKELEGL